MASMHGALKGILDCNELYSFVDQLEKIPKEQEKKRKQFIRRQGSILRRDTARMARQRVKKTAVNRKKYQRTAGQYHKSIKRGRYYQYPSGADCIRVYSYDPISHLIELGFEPVLRNGKNGRHVQGKLVFKDTAEKFEPEFYKACEEFAVGYKAEIEK